MEKITNCTLCSSNQLICIDAGCNISRCMTCGYIFDNPRPTREEIAQYYSAPSKYDDWLTATSERETLWNRRLKKLLRHDVGGDLLDIGTGIGQFLAVASSNFATLTGTEVSASAVRIARENYGLDIVNDELDRIDFGNRRFDTITLFHVLEHVHNPVALIKKCHALLRDGGTLVIAVPNEFQSFRQKVRGILKRLGLLKGRFHGKYGTAKIVLDGSLDEIHLSHFTPEVVASLVKRQGFAILENGLDPYYAAKGRVRLLHDMYYSLMHTIWRITGQNYYDAIWLVSKKLPGSPNGEN